MQTAWQAEAESRPITQLTRPEVVHEFIASQPGLIETCADYLRYLITYAPQLTIRGFGGAYEEDIEALYRESISRSANKTSGTALTTDGNPPRCAEELVLRDPDFGRYRPAMVAGGFVQGHYVANGPPVMFEKYRHIDYLAWLLSDDSAWLPAPVREMLTTGMGEWGVCFRDWTTADSDLADAPYAGRFAESLEQATRNEDFRPDDDAERDLSHRLAFAARLLHLPETGEELAHRLTGGGVLDAFFKGRLDREARREEYRAPF